jgi:hypothetical protein
LAIFVVIASAVWLGLLLSLALKHIVDCNCIYFWCGLFSFGWKYGNENRNQNQRKNHTSCSYKLPQALKVSFEVEQ